MPFGFLRFAPVWLILSLSLPAASCVYRPLPLPDGTGGGAGGFHLDGSGGGAGGVPQPPGGSGGTTGTGGRGSGGTTGTGGRANGSGGGVAGRGSGGINGSGGDAGTPEVPDASPRDGGDAGVDSPEVTDSGAPPPRLIAPLSTATVTSQRPTLRWALAAGTDGAHVQICRDRACAAEVTSFDADGASAAPAEALPPGVLFWHAYGRSAGATGTESSPTWEMTVGNRSAPIDASWGTTLDVNGDGYADVIVGAEGVSGGTGQAYVYLGGAAGISSSPTATLTGPDGGIGYFGVSVASAGDVNGDGYADVVIGAFGINDDSGSVYLYLGGAAGLSLSPAATLTGPDGTEGSFGYSVASAGDVDGDGYADVIVGAAGAAGSGTGQAYLYLGGAAGLSLSPAATLTGPGGPEGNFGLSVAGAGDVNGDGFADVIIGTNAGPRSVGSAYLYLGSAAGLSSSPTATLIRGDGLGGNFGVSVAGAGDVNGDGFADVIVGANADTNSTGSAYLYLGGAAGLSSSPAATLSGPDGPGGNFGASVAGAGDVNGDGFADVVIGAYTASSTAGRAYFYLGGAAGLSALPSVAFTGADGGYFGQAVAGAGDVNGDGFADVIIGAFEAGNGTGSAYLYLGSGGGLSSSPVETLTGPDGPHGYNGYFGISVASAGEPSPVTDRAGHRAGHRAGRRITASGRRRS